MKSVNKNTNVKQMQKNVQLHQKDTNYFLLINKNIFNVGWGKRDLLLQSWVPHNPLRKNFSLKKQS